MALRALGLTALCLLVLAPAAHAARVRDYDLGRVRIASPGPFGPLPIRLWGAIGVPQRPGPRPPVLVLHGRHGDDCPIGELDSETWPCFRRERRNDLGLLHVVRALAERGMVAVAPDLNGAFTGGWGEPDDRRRWPRIVKRTLAELARENTSGGGRFGVPLRGRVDVARLGLLGHSLSGRHAARFARSEPVGALFLLQPVPGGTLPDVPAAIALGTCDGDTGTSGRSYFVRARRDPDRTAPASLIRLTGANHNFFNRTLSRLGLDDAPGRCRRRLRAGTQQRWLERAAADFFAATLRGARRPAWMRRGGPALERVYGLRALVRRLP
jgi:dienelactone hydrolase